MKSSDLPKITIPRDAGNICLWTRVQTHDALLASHHVDMMRKVIDKIGFPVLRIIRQIIFQVKRENI